MTELPARGASTRPLTVRALERVESAPALDSVGAWVGRVAALLPSGKVGHLAIARKAGSRDSVFADAATPPSTATD